MKTYESNPAGWSDRCLENPRRLNRSLHYGFTIIELFVAVGIIGLLIAILLPALQAARESARAASCRNNLRQIGIALHGYHEVNNVFPAAVNGAGFSCHTQLLPYLDQTNLFNVINFSESTAFFNISLTATQYSLSTFLCPSDGAASTRRGSTSYAACGGDGTLHNGVSNGVFPEREAVIRTLHVSSASVIDGLSNTAAISEWLIGLPDPSGDSSTRRRMYYWPSNVAGPPTTSDDFVDRCNSLRDMTATPHLKGDDLFIGGELTTAYNHAMMLNEPSCGNTRGSVIRAGVTAGSFHPGGANVLLSDGHVSFDVDTTSLAVWRALATRAGGEIR